MNAKLERNIGIATGTAYCVTIIIGAGVLALPGAAFQAAGLNSVYAWLFDLLLTVPLLFIFSKLIALVQSAGGIADFVRFAYGPRVLYKTAQLVLVVTLFAGTAAIPLVGAQYLGSAVGMSSTGVTLLGLALIFFPTLINSMNVKLGGTVQKIWAATLIGFLLLVIFSTMKNWRLEHVTSFDLHRIGPTWQTMGLIWFAFTGVEMISFLGEEFESPRHFITSVVLSFAIVGFIYMGLALAVASSVPIDDPLLISSPIIAVLNHTLGPSAGWIGGILGFGLILVNLNGAIMGASRLIFSVGREGVYLPAKLGELNESKVPIYALWTLSVGSMLIVGVIQSMKLEVQAVFLLVSQNWFLLYVMAILAFIRVEKIASHRAVGIIALVISFVFMGVFSWFLWIPALIFAGVWLSERSSTSQGKVDYVGSES